MACEWFDIWDLICTRRMGQHQWELAPQGGCLRRNKPALAMFWPVVERNLAGLRLRWTRACASLISDTRRPLTFDDGSVLQVPSEALYRFPQHVPLILPTPFVSVRSTFIPRRVEAKNETIPTAQTPKCAGSDLDGPSPQRARTPAQGAMDLKVLKGQELDDVVFC